MKIPSTEETGQPLESPLELPLELLSDADWRAGGEALTTLRPALNVDIFASRRQQLKSDGYRLVGTKVGDEVVSVAGFTISPHALHGRELLVHDMATKPRYAAQGYASKLLEYIESVAKAEGCWRIFVHTKNAAGFYLKNAFQNYSTGLVKMVDK